jgi:hypothetical protein
MAYSAVTEALIPLRNEGKNDEFFHNLIGIPVIFAGTGIFVYGGYRIVRGTFSVLSNEKLISNTSKIRTKVISKEIKSAAREENFRMLLNARNTEGKYLWLRSSLITTGGIIINLKQII